MRWILIFVIVLVLPLVLHYLLGIGYDDCRYSNGNGAFTFEEANFSGRDYAQARRLFLDYKALHPNDTVLYRLCPMRPWEVWKYGDYLIMSKYRLPYRSWEEIEKHRVPFGDKENFQNF